MLDIIGRVPPSARAGELLELAASPAHTIAATSSTGTSHRPSLAMPTAYAFVVMR